jgi:mannitol/fructose-specific phosphotransferase system IIA component (Ntr-type)
MTTITDLLKSENVRLNLEAVDSIDALTQVAVLLRDDPVVVDWEKLFGTFRVATPCINSPGSEFGICLAHARTSAVTAMIMSAGRSPNGVVFPACLHPVRYVFCIGVPVELDADYLRIVGLLARILKEPESEAQLREVTSPAAFVAALSRLEARL